MTKPKVPQVPKARNYHCLNAIQRHAGNMGDQRKERSRSICRNPIVRLENDKTSDNYWDSYEEE